MKLSNWHHEKIELNAKKATNRYRRKVWWGDPHDMVQEAIKEQYAAARTLDLSGRVDANDYFGAAMYRIAAIAIKRLLMKASAPVSAHHRVDDLKGLIRAPLFDSSPSRDGAMRAAVRPELTEHSTPYHLVRDAMIAHQVRQRVAELLGDDGAEFALALLTGEFAPHDVVEEHGVTPKEVWSTVRRMKDQLSSDGVLHELWRNS